MTSLAITLIFSIVVIVLMVNSIKIAGQSERFAIFVMGRFQDFKGPGMFLIAPFIQIAVRLKVGDVGLVNGSGFATFGEIDIPAAGLDSYRQGQSVRIDGFDGSEPILTASAIPAKKMCPNCGHQF